MGDDGLFYATSTNLNDYYQNDNGKLVTGSDFYYSSRKTSIEVSARSMLLKAELRGNHWWKGDFWKANDIDLTTCLVVRRGQIVFEKQ
jgi:hypothetical protein